MTKTFSSKRTMFLVAALVLTLFTAPFAALAVEVDTLETEASITFEAGNLELISAPDLDFGSHTISNDEEEYEAVTISNDVVVSDLRGTGSGWTLTAQLSAFNHLAPGTDSPTLSGAFITIAEQSLTGSNGNASPAPSAASAVELISGGSLSTILSASAGNGMGGWESAWENSNVTLTVLPGTAKIGASYATINWSLQDTP